VTSDIFRDASSDGKEYLGPRTTLLRDHDVGSRGSRLHRLDELPDQQAPLRIRLLGFQDAGIQHAMHRLQTESILGSRGDKRVGPLDPFWFAAPSLINRRRELLYHARDRRRPHRTRRMLPGRLSDMFPRRRKDALLGHPSGRPSTLLNQRRPHPTMVLK